MIKIPIGVDENENIILRNCGNIINEQCMGDIRIIINIQNTTEFKRNGLDLYYNKKISLKDALCGFTFDIIHLNGQNICINNRTKYMYIYM